MHAEIYFIVVVFTDLARATHPAAVAGQDGAVEVSRRGGEGTGGGAFEVPRIGAAAGWDARTDGPW